MSFWDQNKDSILKAGKATARGIGHGSKKLGKAGYNTYKKHEAEKRGEVYVPPSADSSKNDITAADPPYQPNIAPSPAQSINSASSVAPTTPPIDLEKLNAIPPPPKRNVGVYAVPQRGEPSAYASALNLAQPAPYAQGPTQSHHVVPAASPTYTAVTPETNSLLIQDRASPAYPKSPPAYLAHSGLMPTTGPAASEHSGLQNSPYVPPAVPPRNGTYTTPIPNNSLDFVPHSSLQSRPLPPPPPPRTSLKSTPPAMTASTDLLLHAISRTASAASHSFQTQYTAPAPAPQPQIDDSGSRAALTLEERISKRAAEAIVNHAKTNYKQYARTAADGFISGTETRSTSPQVAQPNPVVVPSYPETHVREEVPVLMPRNYATRAELSPTPTATATTLSTVFMPGKHVSSVTLPPIPAKNTAPPVSAKKPPPPISLKPKSLKSSALFSGNVATTPTVPLNFAEEIALAKRAQILHSSAGAPPKPSKKSLAVMKTIVPTRSGLLPPSSNSPLPRPMPPAQRSPTGARSGSSGRNIRSPLKHIEDLRNAILQDDNNSGDDTKTSHDNNDDNRQNFSKADWAGMADISTGWFTHASLGNMPKSIQAVAFKTSREYRGSANKSIVRMRLPTMSILQYTFRWQGDNWKAATVETSFESAASFKNPSDDELRQYSKQFGSQVAQQAVAYTNQVVGNGECWDLAKYCLEVGCRGQAMVSTGYHHGFPIMVRGKSVPFDIKTPDRDQIRVGDIIQLNTAVFKLLKGTITAGDPNHTVVIIKVDGTKLTVMQSNVNHDRSTKEGEYDLSAHSAGGFVVFRPVPAGLLGKF